MALEIVVTTDRWKNDPTARSFVEFVSKHQTALQLSDAILYYDFPAYIDYESATIRPDLLLLSPTHGFVAIRFVDDSLFQRSKETLPQIDAALGDFCSNLYSRLLRSRELRKNRSQSIVEVRPLLYSKDPLPKDSTTDLDAELCASFDAFTQFLKTISTQPLGSNLLSEVRSVVEGAKALSRPQKRQIEDPARQPLAAALGEIEAQITNFDEKQRRIALVEVGGPARIRGLAGSGKTVILAMKAAHIHLNNPEATILVTFFTKSLRDTIRNMITKFYRHYSETDPNWSNIHIRHGWGGSSIPGTYSDACRRHGQTPLKFTDAKSIAKRGEPPFAAACRDLQERVKIEPYYDYVLIDEGQDFPDSFYQLCLQLTKGERDRQNIVWAYDELQDIMNVKIRQPDELFGLDANGQPRVDLDRSSIHAPPGAINDAVLSKCYRNQRDILVTAHAVGFGIYGGIVQLLESKAHWEDVGYEVPSGELQTGKDVVVIRPDQNSPLPIPDISGYSLLDSHEATEFGDEVSWVAKEVKLFIDGGLAPEEVLVIALDDRHAKRYLANIAEQLAQNGISSNNIIADPYTEPPFVIAGKVTLSTVYRAKGNEAAAVIAVGVDGVETRTRDGRNKLFTAFTRSKVWLRVSGFGKGAKRVIKELKQAFEVAPKMKFKMPDLKQIDTIQRGFSKKQAAAKKARDEYARKLRAAGFSEDEIAEEMQGGSQDE